MASVDADAVAEAIRVEIERQTEASFASMNADELEATVLKLEEQLAKAKAALAAQEAASATPAVSVAPVATDGLPDLPWGCTLPARSAAVGWWR